ncbi:hypothetical protein R3X25_08300 [Lutibacter sp. TH_r2]|uniref:hypothetical protein n=1 Tax=Lutibacter sp. TH_r2 TaxID=3082083 RepID=UPI002954D492|nr:hypothetical protein [Lutibacter sp. TH_r2]MDV7187277.1 hypothetical protein [Lutibacter sp. TH_r2]
MSLKSIYKIINNHNLIIELHKGDIDLNSYIKFKQKLINDNSFKTGCNYFIHFKNVKFDNQNFDDIIEFKSFIGKISKNKNSRKIAIVTDTPNQVVTLTLFKEYKDHFTKNVEIFSTNKKAIQWLFQNKFNEDIDLILNELDQNI